MTRTKSPQDEADLWNREHDVGTLVRCWAFDRESAPKVGRTRSHAEVLSGHTAVVWIDGIAGCIALSHVEPVS